MTIDLAAAKKSGSGRASLRILLFAASIQLPIGYKIRGPLVGAAKNLFDRYQKMGDPTRAIRHSATQPSHIFSKRFRAGD